MIQGTTGENTLPLPPALPKESGYCGGRVVTWMRAHQVVTFFLFLIASAALTFSLLYFELSVTERALIGALVGFAVVTFTCPCLCLGPEAEPDIIPPKRERLAAALNKGADIKMKVNEIKNPLEIELDAVNTYEDFLKKIGCTKRCVPYTVPFVRNLTKEHIFKQTEIYKVFTIKTVISEIEERALYIRIHEIWDDRAVILLKIVKIEDDKYSCHVVTRDGNNEETLYNRFLYGDTTTLQNKALMRVGTTPNLLTKTALDHTVDTSLSNKGTFQLSAFSQIAALFNGNHHTYKI